MKNLALFIIFTILPFLWQSQEVFKISLDEYQTVENGTTSLESQVKLPAISGTVFFEGLNDLDGMGNYLNIYGSRLIVDSLERSSDGTKQVVLSREDGRDFYDFFPTLSVKLVPMTLSKKEELLNESIDGIK